jgi:hypothetical protein
LADVQAFNKYLGLTSMIVIFVAYCVLLVLLRCRMDKIMIFTSVTNLLGAFLRGLPFLGLDINFIVIIELRLFVSLADWAILYFMIFEMMHIEAIV